MPIVMGVLLVWLFFFFCLFKGFFLCLYKGLIVSKGQLCLLLSLLKISLQSVRRKKMKKKFNSWLTLELESQSLVLFKSVLYFLSLWASHSSLPLHSCSCPTPVGSWSEPSLCVLFGIAICSIIVTYHIYTFFKDTYSSVVII